MDLDQFMKVAFSSDDSERGILEARGFTVAAERDWLGTDGVEYDTQLIQFATADGAKSHVLGQQGAYAGDKTTSSSFTIPNSTLGKGFENDTQDQFGNRVATLLAQDGDVVLLMFVYNPGTLDRAKEITKFQAQLQALASH